MGIVAIIFLSLFIYVPSQAQEIIQLKANQEMNDFEKQLLVLVDKDRKLKSEDIVAGKYDEMFKAIPKNGLNYGFNASNFWVKFKLKNTTPFAESGIYTSANQWFLQNAYAYIDTLILYHRTIDEKITQGFAGDRIKITKHSYPYSSYSFPILLNDNKVHTFYLKINTLGPANIVLKLNNAYQFAQNEFLTQLFYGLFFGSLSIMLLYNLFLFTAIRNTNYLYYCAYVFVYMMAQLANTGIGFYYIWGNHVYWANKVLVIGIHGGILFQNLFTFNFLGIKTFVPLVARLSPFLIGLSIVCLFGVFIFPFKPFAIFTSIAILVNSLFLFFLSIYALYKAKRYAKYYVIGWLTFLLGLSLDNIQVLGFLPYSFFTQHSHQIGAVIELLFFSFALADQINYFRAEKEAAQLEKLALQEELNQGLELKVKKRTAEVSEKNEMLLQTVEKLNSTLDLVKTQKEEIENKQEVLEVQSEELKSTNEKLLQLDQFKALMIGMIVHDLKNPLNTILGISEKPAILQTGKQMLNLIANILDVQKFENTVFKVNLKPESLFTIMQEGLNEVRLLVERKSLLVEIICPQNVIVEADFEIAVRIFVNLLTNAIKFTPNNGKIILKAEESDAEYYLIQVKDNGKGIPQDKLPDIFNKYTQVEPKKSGIINSTGLGLAFCKIAVEAHFGTIWVESSLEIGTTIYFTLLKSKVEPTLTEYDNIPNIQDMVYLKPEFIQEMPLEERALFESYLSKLQKFSVYEYSDVISVIAEIEDKNTFIKNWKKHLDHALRACNEEKYNAMIYFDKV